MRITTGDVLALRDDERFVSSLKAVLLANTKAREKIARRVAKELADVIEGDPQIRRRILEGVLTHESVLKSVKGKLVGGERPATNENAANTATRGRRGASKSKAQKARGNKPAGRAKKTGKKTTAKKTRKTKKKKAKGRRRKAATT